MFLCVSKAGTAFKMKREVFTSCEYEATLFNDLIIYNLMGAHIICLITCLVREIFETNVRLSGQMNRMLEVIGFALYFQGVVKCIFYYSTWSILSGSFDLIVGTIGDVSV